VNYEPSLIYCHINQNRNQVAGLTTSVEFSEKSGRAIESHIQLVEGVLVTMRAFVSAGMDWVELDGILKAEAMTGNNPVASCVKGLKLESGVVCIELLDPDFEEEEEEEGDEEESDGSEEEEEDESRGGRAIIRKLTPAEKAAKAKKIKEAAARRKAALLKIDLDIYQSAYANARRYYDSKKLAAVKGWLLYTWYTFQMLKCFIHVAEKTIAASVKALKMAETKIAKDLKQAQSSTSSIRTIRKTYWFEKFAWFISSENYLCVAGRDPSQSEILIKK
jgi:hypothetical protein